MINPTASLSIDRAGLSLAALVFSGVDDDLPFGLVTMNRPPRIPRVTYADRSNHVAGALPIQSVYELTTLSATVKITGSTPAELASRESELNVALAQFGYTVTQSVNGIDTAWTAHMGAVNAATDLQYEDLRRLWQTFNVTIPVQPQEA